MNAPEFGVPHAAADASRRPGASPAVPAAAVTAKRSWSSVIGWAWLRYWPFSGFGILQTPAYPGVPASAP